MVVGGWLVGRWVGGWCWVWVVWGHPGCIFLKVKTETPGVAKAVLDLDLSDDDVEPPVKMAKGDANVDWIACATAMGLHVADRGPESQRSSPGGDGGGGGGGWHCWWWWYWW